MYILTQMQIEEEGSLWLAMSRWSKIPYTAKKAISVFCVDQPAVQAPEHQPRGSAMAPCD